MANELGQLGVDLTTHTGENCKPYPHEIGLDELRDPFNDTRIIKMAVDYKKRKVIRVPLSLQGKLEIANFADDGGNGTQVGPHTDKTNTNSAASAA